MMLSTDVSAHGTQKPAPTAPANALESITADLASDLPELLMATPQLVAPTTRFDRQARHPLHALPHPFPERPQRPPRLITRHA